MGAFEVDPPNVSNAADTADTADTGHSPIGAGRADPDPKEMHDDPG